MLTLVSTIANNGKKFTPRLVKATVNGKTGERNDIPVIEGEQVISEESSKKVLSMMESVVSEGTGKKAQVKGYYVGGKTGTSEDGVNTNRYVTSFVGVADINNPEVVIIIILYNPIGEGGHQGGEWFILSPQFEKQLKSFITRVNRRFYNEKINN